MAVPTIITVTPAAGPTGGRTLVAIAGTNFRLPPDPPATGPVPVGNPTVSITFGGVPALRVRVFTSTLLVALTPIYDLGAVAVQLKNLDDAGVPIVGEVATKTPGFTYARPSLTSESNLIRLVRALRQEMARQIIENVVLLTSTDYSSAPETGVVTLATLPGIALLGPRKIPSKGGEDNEPTEVQLSETVFDTLRPTRATDLSFDVVGVSDSDVELLNLLHATEAFFDRNPTLSMLRDPANPSAGTVEYGLAIAPNGEFGVRSQANPSNVRNFTGAVVIQGFVLEGLAGVTDDLVCDRGGREGEDGATIQVERLS
jgi:hypothetical protein